MIKVRFERGRDDVEGPTLGPFEWVQITYAGLRVAPRGEHIAWMSSEEEWYLQARREDLGNGWQEVSADTESEPFSDIIIFPVQEEEANGS